MFLSSIASIRWQDIVDILLLSYILFRLYVIFRDTYAFRVIAGIAVLWIFQQFAISLGLILTSWALRGIMAVAALIIIIVFRNEIRNVLQGKNFQTFLWGFSHKGDLTPVEVIVKSINALSKKHIGALLVFPARDNPGDFVQPGIPWNGLLSGEMITSVFLNSSPVHDGAAIIQGTRISEVGVILPLSHRSDLPLRYGTRHRAALGLAEISDALILVVSEESGKVAAAKDADFTEITDDDVLVRILQKHAGSSEKAKWEIKKETLKLCAAALASFIFITSLWFSFSRGPDTFITLDTPVEYTTRASKLEIIDTSVNTVSLQLSGPETLIKAMRPEQVGVRLDLDKAVVGLNTFPITLDTIKLPPGIFLKKVTPPVVEATIDIATTKEIPLQADLTGKLPENLILTEIVTEPDKIAVTGGNLILEKISTIYSKKIDISDFSQSGKIEVEPLLNSISLRIAPGSPEKFSLSYIIKERVAAKEE